MVKDVLKPIPEVGLTNEELTGEELQTDGQSLSGESLA